MEKQNILIVDDNVFDMNIGSLESKYKSQGIILNGVMDYYNFEESLAEQKPDLIITDLGFTYKSRDEEDMPVKKFKEIFLKYEQNYKRMKEIQKSIRDAYPKKSCLQFAAGNIDELKEKINKGEPISGYVRDFPFGIGVMEKAEEKNIPYCVWTHDINHGFHGLTYAMAKGLGSENQKVVFNKGFLVHTEEGVDETFLYNSKDNRIFVGWKTENNLEKILNFIISN